MCKRSFYIVVSVLALVAGGVSHGGTQKWQALVSGANPVHWYSFDEPAGTTVADDKGSADLDGVYRDLVDVSQDGLFGPGQAVLFERGGQNDVMWTQGGDVSSDEWTAEFIVMKMSGTVAQALSDSAGFSLRLVGWGVDEEISFTEYGVIDARFDAVAGADLVVPVEQWVHLAYRKSGGEVNAFIDGVLVGTTSTLADCPVDSFGGRAAGDSDGMDGFMDEAVIYDYALTDAEILAHAMAPFLPDVGAIAIEPADGATEVLRDTPLRWEAGTYAETHDVYLGTSFDDVNTASRDNPMDVLISQGQAEPTCVPDRLELGQVYYWRVDEVNAAPDNTIFKGDVWSFATEAVAYPVSNVTATTNAVSEDGSGPEKMVDGSGLNADDQHSTEIGDMWQAQVGDADPVQIDFAFDKVYCLYQIMVWNCNPQFETMLGFGIQNVTVEYSADGENWTVLGDVDLAQATGMADYAANTVIDMGGVSAQHVKFTVNSRYSNAVRFGLSEVRFLSIPVHASEPVPADGDADVSVATALAWRPGRQAVSHEVYLATDPNALSLAAIADDTTFTPDALDLAMTYYWRIDEANDAEVTSVWQGDLWSFSTQEYIVVEDFESFDDGDNVIYETWTDGWYNDTGSTVGYFEAPFAETVVVHGGGQAMPLFYNNSGVTTSEADYALSQDWTANGIQSLSLFFCGDADNEGGQLYVAINGTKIPYDGSADDITSTAWLPWNIDLSTVAGNLSNVTSLTIGVEGSGANGVLYVDDIRLYPKTPEVIVPTMPDETNLVAYFTFEGDFSDSVGSHATTVLGGAEIVSDATQGQVLSLDGNGDFVDVTYSADLNPEAFTASVWANPDPSGIDYRSPLSARDEPPQSGYILYLTPANIWQTWVGTGTGWSGIGSTTAELGEWTHLAATGQDGQQKLYVNGVLVAEGAAALALNTQRPLRIGGGATESETGNYFFQGLLDEVRIYNRILSEEEVAGLSGRTDPLHKAF